MRRNIGSYKYLILCGMIIFIIIVFNFPGNTIQTGFANSSIEQAGIESNKGTDLNAVNEDMNIQTTVNQAMENNIGSGLKDKEGTKTESDKGIINSTIISEEEPETYFLTYKEIVSLTKVSFKDKLFCTFIASKMKRTDVSRILFLANGGITLFEAAELNKILEKALSRKDINKIYNLLERKFKNINANSLASK